MIDINEFVIKDKDKYRLYVVVRNDKLLFPICVYRFNDTEYSAIWMQCAHQGADLNVAGEYDNRGKVTNGPADRDLRTFPVTISNNQLFIDLRKV